jgi:hypothetical protein
MYYPMIQKKGWSPYPIIFRIITIYMIQIIRYIHPPDLTFSIGMIQIIKTHILGTNIPKLSPRRTTHKRMVIRFGLQGKHASWSTLASPKTYLRGCFDDMWTGTMYTYIFLFCHSAAHRLPSPALPRVPIAVSSSRTTGPASSPPRLQVLPRRPEPLHPRLEKLRRQYTFSHRLLNQQEHSIVEAYEGKHKG